MKRIKKPILIFICVLALSCSTKLNDLIRTRRIEEAISLIQTGEDWKHANDCETPLELAASSGNTELVQLLLERGADPNERAKGCKQESVLYIEGTYISTERFFSANHTPLSKTKNVEAAKLLVRAGADVNWGGYRQNDPQGIGLSIYESPLLNSVINRRYELSEFLIQKGANIQIFNPITGENEFDLWFTSVGIRNKKDKEFYRFLKEKGLKQLRPFSLIEIAKLRSDENSLFTKTYIHIPTKQEIILNANPTDLQNPLETDLIYSSKDQRYFHSSEFVQKETKQNLYELILQRRIARKILPKS
ncbi:ankyrin repeat domain-containing protein [Leptospira sp. FAT2]|uniref:ankyrin repeat domain-containing protein n=1 Tax=Leptospira sanjuanensis TaxID=2879643 RepID=UPI001EE7F75E|nr:ankyrin repeat domain-containing protein [Leptospira sanjuanensis]MCG6168091.1 ankyrin repeat domain-containing protein [Leptospira sanjuanensis]MCG6193508.1 ankyrin repeat domain-containing protein [Leptospira sanjuanensis]